MNTSRIAGHRLGVFIVMALALIPLNAAAQSVTETWPGLRPDTLETVYVLDTSGVETAGRLLGWTPDALLLWQNGAERRVERSALVRVQKRDSLKNGVIVGAVVGTVMGLFTAAIADCPSNHAEGCLGSRAGLAVLSAVTYTGMGVGLDALVRGRTTVYDRESRLQRSSVAASVSRTHVSLGFGLRW